MYSSLCVSGSKPVAFQAKTYDTQFHHEVASDLLP